MDYANIYNLYSKDIFRYALANLKNRDDAEDVLSETFTRIMESKSIGKINDIKFYLFGIARNIMYSKFRKESKLTDLHEESKNIIEDQPSEIDTENIVMTEELIELIKSELDKIDDFTREIIILKLWEDLKFNQISEFLNQKESTVKLRFYRGLEKIKLNLNKKDNKKYVFAIPAISIAIEKLKNAEYFNISENAAANVWKNLNNLYIKDNTMNELSNGQSNAVTKVGFLKSPAKLVIGGLITVGIITSAVIFTAINMNGNSNGNNNSNDPTPTVTHTATIEPTELPSDSEEITIEYQTSGSPDLTETRTVTVKHIVPTGTELTIFDNQNNFDEYELVNENFTLTLATPYEASEVKLALGTFGWNSEEFGIIYIVRSTEDLSTNTFYFSNNATLSGECIFLGSTISSPCGAKSIFDETNTIIYEFKCVATGDGLNDCQSIIRSMEIVSVN